MTLPIRQTGAYYLAFILLGLTFSLQGPTLNVLAAHTGSTLSAISYVFSVFSLGYLIGSLLAGRVFDKFRGHPMVAVSLVVAAGLNLVIPQVSALWALLLTMLLLGTAGAMVDVGCNTLIAWAHGPKVAPFMNGLHLFFGLGALLGPLLVTLMLSNSADVAWAYRIAAIMVLPAALVMLIVPSPAHPIAKTELDGSIRATPWSLVIMICLFFFAIVALELAVNGWIFTYAIRQGLSDVMAAAITSGFWAAFTIGRLIGIPIATRVKPDVVLWIDLALCGIAGIVLLAGGGGLTSTWIGTILAGLGVASLFATMMSFAGTRMHITGAITGYFFVGVSIGSVVVPWIIGQLFDSVGPAVVPMALLLSCAASALVYLVIRRTALGNPALGLTLVDDKGGDGAAAAGGDV